MIVPLDPPPLAEIDPPGTGILVLAGAVLIVAAIFATLRLAMWQSHPGRVLGKTKDPAARAALEPLLARVDGLATSARLFEIAFGLLFTLILLLILSEERVERSTLLVTLGVAAPVLVLFTHAVPQALARRFGDELIIRLLPAFRVLQWPVGWLASGFEVVRRALSRVLGVEEDPHATRRIVEGLREVIADSAIEGDLDETEREIIGNVMEFRDLDVAAVMTPRTEICASDLEDGVEGALKKLAESNHSRVPIYENSLDKVIGTASARDLVQAMATGGLEGVNLRGLLRPAFFVPETKRISELFDELRREKIKHAIVLDEYGGTAGMVTMGDILVELVGELQDEFDPTVPSPLRDLGGGLVEVSAALHVTEVNEALDLDIPEEEDYETLGGFVLARLGRFPKRGEGFRTDEAEYSVIEANDRRVLTVRVRRLAQDKAS